MEEFDFEDFLRKLDRLTEQARETHGPYLLLGELMSPRFVSHCSCYATIDDLFDASLSHLIHWEIQKGFLSPSWTHTLPVRPAIRPGTKWKRQHGWNGPASDLG